MFTTSFLFELKYRFKSAGIWVCFLALTLMAYREMLAGEWDVLVQSGRVARNSAYTVYYLFMYYTFWAATVGGAFVVPTILRDIRSGAADIVYSYPINSKSYFLGKYAAMMLIFIFIMSSVVVGFITMPYLAVAAGIRDASEFAPTPWAHLGHAFLIWVLPACFIYGSIVFSLTTLTGRTGPVYAFIMLAVGLFVTITAVYGDAGVGAPLVQVLDPLGKVTVEGQIYYWTAEERAERFLALEGALLQNRVLYVSIAFLILLFAYLKFDVCRFLQAAKGREAKIASKAARAVTARSNEQSVTPEEVEVNNTPSWVYWLRNAFSSGWKAFGVVAADKAFVIAIFTLLLMVTLSGWSLVLKEFDAAGQLLPKDFLVMPKLMYPTLLFGLVGAVFFSIELCAREKTYHMNELIDACPVPTWSMMLGKLIGVVLLSVVIALVPVVSVLMIQFGTGYFEPNWGNLANLTLLVLMPIMLIYVLISIFTFGVLHNKALSQGVAIILCITPAIFNEVSTVENYMLLWAWPFPATQFSDFESDGQFIERYQMFAAYWLSFYLLLSVVAYWLWPRGTAGGVAKRMADLKSRFGLASGLLAAAFGMVFVWSSTTIYQTMMIQNDFKTRDEMRAEKAEYEKKYAVNRYQPQPKISVANLQVDLFPAEQRADYSGNFTVVNKSNSAINRLILEHAEDVSIKAVSVNNGGVEASEVDPVHRRVEYSLPQSLEVGDVAQLKLKMEVDYHGFTNDDDSYNSTIVGDGSYFGSTMWPTFGYDRGRELDLSGIRSEFGLGERKPAQNAGSARTAADFSLSDDADFVMGKITVITDEGQIALAPGKLVGISTKNGRSSFTYEQRVMTPWNMQVVSAQYAVDKTAWTTALGKIVTIEIYHHPEHIYNLERFKGAAKSALVDAEKLWGEFPYNTLRIAEVPNAMVDELTTGNLIIVPENKGWVQDYNSKPDVDWITYQVARDVARVWWGQQLAVADVKGAKLLEDGIPVLHGLRALQARNQNGATAFLDIMTDSYLRLRAKEDGVEPSILDLEDEEYADVKASLALYQAYGHLGHEVFMGALSNYFKTSGLGAEAPYPNASDLLEALVNVAPDGEKAGVQQLFELTRYHDFRVESAATLPVVDGHMLRTSLSATVYTYDGGQDISAGFNGVAGLAIYGGKGGETLLYSGDVSFLNGQSLIEVLLPSKPLKVHVNPQRYYLERSPNDNEMAVR